MRGGWNKDRGEGCIRRMFGERKDKKYDNEGFIPVYSLFDKEEILWDLVYPFIVFLIAGYEGKKVMLLFCYT